MMFFKKLVDKLIVRYVLRYNGILQTDKFTVKAYSNGFYWNVVNVAVKEKIVKEKIQKHAGRTRSE